MLSFVLLCLLLILPLACSRFPFRPSLLKRETPISKLPLKGSQELSHDTTARGEIEYCAWRTG